VIDSKIGFRWLARGGVALALFASACSDAGEDGETDGTTGGPGSTAPSSSPMTSAPGDDDGDETSGCVLGTLGCACLEGACSQPDFCVEDVCVLGPEIEIDEPREALAGLAVPLEVEVMADEFSWSQIDGPEVELLGAEGPQVVVNLPPDLAPGDVITLAVDAVRNTVPLQQTTSITILEPVFEDALPDVTDPMELGTAQGVAFDNGGQLWVASVEGFVSQFDDEAGLLQRVDVPGMPLGLARYDESILVANAGNASVVQVNSVSGNVSTLFDSVDGGGAIGPVAQIAVSPGSDDVYVSNGASGQVVRWAQDDQDDEIITTIGFFAEGLTNPGAVAFGPEGDSALYIGVPGHVLRVSVEAGGIAGTPAEYVTLPSDVDDTYAIAGLAFDEGGNLWIACPNAETLFLARYSSLDAVTPIREFAMVGAGISAFTGLSFGRDDFGDDTLYWADPAGSTVGRLRTGLQAL
jgi:sugar lactone lactonase YvrE